MMKILFNDTGRVEPDDETPNTRFHLIASPRYVSNPQPIKVSLGINLKENRHESTSQVGRLR